MKTEMETHWLLSARLSLGRAKDIVVKSISSTDANRIVKKFHYSGKVVNNSQVHLGVFLDGKCGGAMQFGPSLDKRKIQGLVSGTLWNEFIELNRMAFADWLPRNSESRAIGYAMRWIKKTYPFIKWVVSFADGTQCGDGTIYRASGFVLTSVKENCGTWNMSDGEVVNVVTYGKAQHARNNNGSAGSVTLLKKLGATKAVGYQLRYIYFIDPTAKERLTVPILPFSEIERRGAGMYLGKPRATSKENVVSAIHAEGGGAIPTVALHIPEYA
jgi:hypothetical protein